MEKMNWCASVWWSVCVHVCVYVCVCLSVYVYTQDGEGKKIAPICGFETLYICYLVQDLPTA